MYHLEGVVKGMERGVGEEWERRHEERRKNEKEKVYRNITF